MIVRGGDPAPGVRAALFLGGENHQRELTPLMTLVPRMWLLIVIILFATFRSLALSGSRFRARTIMTVLKCYATKKPARISCSCSRM